MNIKAMYMQGVSVSAAANAVTQQADMIRRDHEMTVWRVAAFKSKIRERALGTTQEAVVLTHKSRERCALEPGWDVV